ncbi:GTP-binding protein [Clostridium sp.]|uniref:GTP-binding protein n=1 Tax=Clostridium sp. TaxID=1506 RepID=UPI0039951F6D
MNITVGVFAHVDAGKTTFSEQLLYHGQTIRNPGRVDHKNSYLDNHYIEKERGITVFSDVGIFNYNNNKYYLIDTPGHIDFSPEMERVISVLDYAILIISSVEGIQGHSETIWEMLRKNKIPTCIFINKTDRNGSNLEKVIEEVKLKLSENIIYLSNEFNLEKWCDSSIEELAQCDEELLVTYLEEGYSKEVWNKSLTEFFKREKIFPVFSGSALLDKGIKEFLNIFSKITETNYKEEGNFTGRVFKIKHDEKGERLTFIKVLTGVIKPKDIISYNYSDKLIEEKVNSIRLYNGSKFSVLEKAEAGDIVAILGISNLEAGEGIGIESNKEYKMVPALKSKVIFSEKINPREVLKYFKILESEDKSLGVTWNEEAKEININIMGTVQLEVLKEILRERFKMEIDFGTPTILYKETALGESMGGGHFEPLGHYAEVIIKIKEGIRGKGIKFINKCHTDHLTIGHQNLIKTHIYEREHNGILIGSPVTDLEITLVTGRAHNKHTSGGDFREATKRALRQGLENMDNKLLEPFYKFKIDVNTNLMGRVISDIQKMKGEFLDPKNNGERIIIEGRGPVATFMNYPLEFQSFTKGKGNLSLIFDGYDFCHNEEEIIDSINYNKEADINYTSTSIFCSKGQAYLVEGKDAMQEMHCLKK